MLWVCRPGKLAKNYYLFIHTNRIYLAWDGPAFVKNYDCVL